MHVSTDVVTAVVVGGGGVCVWHLCLFRLQLTQLRELLVVIHHLSICQVSAVSA